MKKGLLFLAGSLLGFASMGQYDPSAWVVNDKTVNVGQVTALTGTHEFADQWNEGNTEGEYTLSHDGTVTTVNFENKMAQDAKNWADFRVSTIGWNVGEEGGAITYFGADGTECIGYSVNMEENPTIELTVSSDVDLNFRVDLVDIANKLSNDASPNQAITGGAAPVTYTVNWADDPLADLAVAHAKDSYTGEWYGVTVTADDKGQLLDLTRIVALAFTIDQGEEGAEGDKKVVQIHDIKLGMDATNTATMNDKTPIKISYPPTAVKAPAAANISYSMGVVNAEGAINIVSLASGQVVASGINTVDCNGLVPGVYAAVVNGATKKIVVE